MNAVTFAVARAADANAAADAGVVSVAGLRQRELACVRAAIARLGISDVQRVGPLVDVYPARPAELEPLRDEFAVCVEHLDAVILTIADEESAARVERERVNDVELAGAHAFPAPRLQ